MKQKKARILAAALLILLAAGYGLIRCRTKTTYLEYTYITEEHEKTISVYAGGELTQEFIMPYDTLARIVFRIGTGERDNNSNYTLEIRDSGGRTVHEGSFRGSPLEDPVFLTYRLNRPIAVKKGAVYTLAIRTPDAVKNESNLAFYTSGTSVTENLDLARNGEVLDRDLYCRLMGGDTDPWWYGFTIVTALILLGGCGRALYTVSRGKKLREDRILLAMAAGLLVFLVLCTYAPKGDFLDEKDSLQGGMTVAGGGVIYRDYTTQHTPLMYYLCGAFALMGAGSVEQFRLSWYLFQAILWGLAFLRYEKTFGRKKAFWLPVILAVCLSAVLDVKRAMVLPDALQGILITLLLMEYLAYRQDRKLSWGRCALVSVYTWGAVGAAFVSVYAAVFAGIAFVITEILCHWKEHPFRIREAGKRYGKLLAAMLIPPAAAVLYFAANRALPQAIDQCYTFNREVYPLYMDGFGTRIIEPFVTGWSNYFEIIRSSVSAVIQGKATATNLLQLAVIAAGTAVCVRLMEQKKWGEGLCALAMMIFSGTRGYNFHGLAAFSVAAAMVALYPETLKTVRRKVSLPAVALALITCFSLYAELTAENLLLEQQPVTELEQHVAAMAEEEGDREIFLDAASVNSMYLYYKEGTPVNPAVYMLPWYMDRYEEENIRALEEKKPRIVVYDPDREGWGYTHYNNAFDRALEKDYTRLGETGTVWEYAVWVRNE